jgi:hypothetical protein
VQVKSPRKRVYRREGPESGPGTAELAELGAAADPSHDAVPRPTLPSTVTERTAAGAGSPGCPLSVRVAAYWRASGRWATLSLHIRRRPRSCFFTQGRFQVRLESRAAF